jgi:indolepyruvate ferredoxin oxidoreductase
MKIDEHQVESSIVSRTGEELAWFVDATTLALKLLGDTIASNMFMLGYAIQQGLLPVSLPALEKAITLNGIAVDSNLTALSLGRLFAHSPDRVISMLPETSLATNDELALTLDELIEHRTAHLTSYQSKAWAKRYRATVDEVRKAEAALGWPESETSVSDVLSGSSESSELQRHKSENSEGEQAETLSRAVAHNLAKLMSYKDEYEVARLFVDPQFKEKLDAQFEPGYTLKFNLAPPLISRKHPSTGLPMKREFGGWMMSGFQALTRLKILRGTPLDIFGFSEERRQERQLIKSYEAMVGEVVSNLSADNFDDALRRASLPEEIRGYGHVKDKSLKHLDGKFV